VISKAGVAVMLGAYRKPPALSSGSVSATIRELSESIAIARRACIRKERIIVDPSIGFFRETGGNDFYTRITDMPWYLRDLAVLSDLGRIARLGPVCISVSAKSFLGHLLNIQDPADRLAPSLACEIMAAQKGASIIRTHNVRESVQALTTASLL